MAEEQDLLKKAEIEEFIKKYELNKFKGEFFERLSLFIVAAFGLITALAWDEMLKDLFVYLFGHLDSVFNKFLYALILTIVTVVVTLILRSFIKKKSKKIFISDIKK
jgi:hypothetical protein